MEHVYDPGSFHTPTGSPLRFFSICNTSKQRKWKVHLPSLIQALPLAGSFTCRVVYVWYNWRGC